MLETELETVSVTVPKDRVGDLYQFVAGLYEPVRATVVGDQGPDRIRPWMEQDVEVAAAFYGLVSPKARAILDVLMDLPKGQVLCGEALARAVGLEKGAYGVAGSLSSVGKAAGKLHRALPYVATPGESGESSDYLMPRLVAELFRAARAAEAA